MNKAAVVGFVSSLVVCIPLIAQLLGLVLGIAGIVGTSGGRSRGRGLAIAAVVISPLVALAWLAVGLAGYKMFAGTWATVSDVRRLLAAEAAELPTVATQVRDKHFSDRLKLVVDEHATVTFVESVIAAHGRLNDLTPSDQGVASPGVGQELIMRMKGEFTNGTTEVLITLGFPGPRPEIDNLQVGDLVLAPER